MIDSNRSNINKAIDIRLSMMVIIILIMIERQVIAFENRLIFRSGDLSFPPHNDP